MSLSTTLPADLAATVRPTYARGSLTRPLSRPYGGAVLAAAVLALIAEAGTEQVTVAAVDGSGLVTLRAAVGERTTLAELLAPERDPADPQARVLVAADADRAEVDRLALGLRDCDCLFLLAGDAGDRRLECDYDADRYTAATMAWHLDRLESILESLDDDPGTPLAEVVIAPDALPIAADWHEDAYVAPRTPTEEALAAIWAEVLEVPRVGAEDDFFAMGGHSILAARALTRIRAAFDVEVHFDELFAAPTLARCAEVVDAAAVRGPVRGPVRPLVKAPDGHAVVSLEQERLWFLEQWRPGTALHNVPLVLELTGPADAGELRQALQRVVDRHPALRTAFVTVDGQPRPVTRAAAVPWRHERAADGAAAWEAVRGHLREPFDLGVPPLVRAGLVSHAHDRHLLWICVHHLAVDGWSLDHLLDDLTTACRGRALPPPDELGYADYAAWQRSRPVDEGLAWWREHLDGLPPLLELPSDHRRPAVQSFGGGTRRHVVPPELARALTDFARARSATVFDVALTVFALVLRRWTGRSDLPIATPVAARPLPELEPLVGFFVNTLVVRADVSGEPSFGELVDRVRRGVAGALSHQDVPFALLVEALQPERALTHAPLVQVAFAHYRPSRHSWALTDGLTATMRLADTGTAKFDLTFTVHDAPGEMAVEVEYATDLFEADTADRLAEQWQTLLRRLLAAPGRPVSRVSALPERQRRRLAGWSAGSGGSGSVAGPEPVSVPELVARQVAGRPDAVAVSDGAVRLTYAELWARSGALAARLGPRRGEPVGLACRRGADLVVAMLAILRAGAAYVPLDPAYPAARLSFMLEDSGARLVVGHRDLLAGLPLAGRAGLAVDGPGAEIGAAPQVEVGPEDAAYVIYTSGSTGRPKGVVIPHRGIIRLVRETDYVALDGTTVIAQVSNASFDAITFEVWGALTNGGRVAVTPPETVLSPVALAALLRAERVTTAFLTTSLFNATTSEVPDAFATVEQLYVGGEALDVARIGEVLRGGLGPKSLHNAYGPTEVTTFSTCRRLTEPPTVRGPIGRPIANTTAWVVDLDTGDLAAAGVPGELWLGGPGVAWGYWDRPGRTASSFVADPFSGTAGARLYRTGDLARWNGDGTLEFLGRVDRQLKIRGFRVEPGEVELAMSALPGVRGCAVVALEPESGPVELAGYVQPGPGVTLAGLREGLARELPEHLIPAHLILVDRLPLTPNGKVDLSALPAPERQRAEAAAVAPDGPVEELLAAIWAEVLGVERLGATDDFFDLGGHSLHAVKVTTRIERALRTTLSVRDLFRHKTVRRLAAALRSADGDRLDRVAAIVLQVRQARVVAEKENADAH
ncbi:amino acid adenylation domain-containing protein [Nonomuraea sp. NPDC003804]|uniref:amino acid adenylation domain-containing protein n=1 Tax=Nonomuraea sp. NPDC003804 TaxID=3154547 RepID=UPI0033B661D1